MKKIIIAAILGLCGHAAWAGAPTKAELIETGIDSDLYMSDAQYFPAEGDRAVIWVPGFIFNKESWAKMAKAAQKEGIASLTLSGKLEKNIREGVRELVRRGHSDIILVGGSSGAAAVLNMMEQVTATDPVTGVVLLSPVRGNPMDDQPVRKLFFVSEGERSFEKVEALFAGSMAPKERIALPGKAHAQFMLFGPDSKAVSSKIMEFIVE